MLRTFMLALALAFSPVLAQAQGSLSLEGKTVTMIIGHPPGGGTDGAGRMIAHFLAKYLSGKPSVVVQNMPGADGIVAHNHFAQRARRDGTEIVMASSTSADPLHYRQPEAKYDPTKYNLVGGVGRGGTTLIINKDAIARLTDASKPVVMMGAPSGFPRSGMQMTAWGIAFLGWNAKWVSGYRGTKDILIALERGEVDMTATGNLKSVERLINSGKFTFYAQSGAIEGGQYIGRSEISTVPIFAKMMDGKLDQKLHEQAFQYWSSLIATDKWLALPPGVEPSIVKLYREAFRAALNDPDFITRGRAMSEDFTPQSVEDVEKLIMTLGRTPPEAIAYISKMLASQGVIKN